jgi:hypothetical protein
MPEEAEETREKGYRTMEYTKGDGGKVGSLSDDELREVLEGVDSGTMAEQIYRDYERTEP